MSSEIFVNVPSIPQNSQKYVLDCLKSGWISGHGKYVSKFEKEFSKYIGTKYSITTNSGTTALYLALLALGIGLGDEVVLPASTIGSCYFAIWYVGAKAVPVDVDIETYNINPNLIEEKITNKTKAILVVHLYGLPAKMRQIKEIALRYKLKIIEDAAEAHGAEYGNKKIGSIGDIGCFSFYANKIITSGEGGMLVTSNRKIYEAAKQIKGLNCIPNKRFVHAGIGHRFNMTNMQAALGLSSLEEIERSLSRKRKMASIYSHHLKKISGLVLPNESRKYGSVYWVYAILVEEEKFGVSRDELIDILLKKYGIHTRTFFYDPRVAFKKMGKFKNYKFEVAEKISKQGLYLPSGLGNSDEEFEKVCEALKKIHNHALGSQ